MLSERLNQEGWPSAFISGNHYIWWKLIKKLGSQLQTERINTISSIKHFQLRVLVSTDLVNNFFY